MDNKIKYFPQGFNWTKHFPELNRSFDSEVLITNSVWNRTDDTSANFNDLFTSASSNEISKEISFLIQRLGTKVHSPATELLSPSEFYMLLRPEAGQYLEELASLSKTLTEVRFGSNIQFYAPLYLSNECNSRCVYCSFSQKNKIERITLTKDELLKEAKIISEKGIRHILLLTGEDKKKTSISYIAECIKLIKPYFSSISLEIYALDVDEYKILVEAGAEGLTLYQETYDPDVYSKVHLGGKKKNYDYRLKHQTGEAKQISKKLVLVFYSVYLLIGPIFLF